MKMRHRDAVLVLVVLILSIVLLVVPSGFESPFAQDVERLRGQVLEMDNSNVLQFGIVKTGSQTLRVRILDGPHAGQEVEADNNLLGKMDIDKLFKVGDTAFLVIDLDGDRLVSATAYDHYRLDTELLLFALFAALLICFAGWSGVRALLSFVFAVLLIWKVLVPNILLGRDPIGVAIAVVTVMTAATLYLVAGVNKTALVAFLGSLLGVVLTCGLAMVLFPSFHLHGAIQPFSETVLYSGFPHLDLNRVFLAAIFIGASGAVLDVAIDVSTAMNEVVEKRPDLSRKELIRSGLVVGRNMTSTMVTTLLMAYVSGYIALLMMFVGRGIPPISLLNTNYVAAEILKTIVGSFGLVTVAPFTAIIGGLIYRKTEAYMTQDRISPDPILFKIGASRCDLRVGDRVTPETTVGEDFETGETVKAGCHGRVEGISFIADDHALVVVIRPADQ
ncbi:MAG: YibE/F family protein [Chloroflexi bacterium]|nr:YibE/F family protein [Chloroflexota bacterium]